MFTLKVNSNMLEKLYGGFGVAEVGKRVDTRVNLGKIPVDRLAMHLCEELPKKGVSLSRGVRRKTERGKSTFYIKIGAKDRLAKRLSKIAFNCMNLHGQMISIPLLIKTTIESRNLPIITNGSPSSVRALRLAMLVGAARRLGTPLQKSLRSSTAGALKSLSFQG